RRRPVPRRRSLETRPQVAVRTERRAEGAKSECQTMRISGVSTSLRSTRTVSLFTDKVLEFQVLRRAKVVDHRRNALEAGDRKCAQFIGAGQFFAEAFTGGETLAFEVVDQFVIGVETARVA